jgi:dTDP-4-dehydrorhamnose 3,5-epimerase
MRRFDFSPTSLDGVFVVQRNPRFDERGFLERVYCETEFASQGLSRPLVQINRTLTKSRGVVRGLHFQRVPYQEAKLVTCYRGRIFDVAVDMRQDSPSFLKWYGVELSSDNRKSLFISEGFAHGFQTLSDDCELLYLHSAPYTPSAEAGVNPLDPDVNVCWPLPISEISERDAKRALLRDAKGGPFS